MTPKHTICTTLFRTAVETGEKVPEFYVRTITEPIHHTNRILTFDNWFTTIKICRKMKNEFGLNVIATIRKNKREIPNS